MSSERKGSIEFRSVSKVYSEDSGPLALKGFLDRIKNGHFLGKLVERDSFTALDNISFRIEPGERVGVIGHNGAGKSTTLRLINKLAFPSSGEVIVNGEVGGVLDLGVGFESNLTARDNIMLQGAIYNYSPSEVRAMIQPIMEICELADFIDVPLKKYSSGMKVRLGFAIAMTTAPDIVLLDEVLSVGDMRFRKKSMTMMEQFLSGRTLVFVSHRLSEVNRLCERVLVVSRGRLLFDGPTSEGISFYKDLVNNGPSTQDFEEKIIPRGVKRGKPRLWKVRTTRLSLRESEIQEGASIQGEVFGESSPDIQSISVVFKVRKSSVSHLRDLVYQKTIQSTPEQLRQGLGFEFSTDRLSPGTYWIDTLAEDASSDKTTAVVVTTQTFVVKKAQDNKKSWRGLVNLDLRLSKTASVTQESSADGV